MLSLGRSRFSTTLESKASPSVPPHSSSDDPLWSRLLLAAALTEERTLSSGHRRTCDSSFSADQRAELMAFALALARDRDRRRKATEEVSTAGAASRGRRSKAPHKRGIAVGEQPAKSGSIPRTPFSHRALVKRPWRTVVLSPDLDYEELQRRSRRSKSSRRASSRRGSGEASSREEDSSDGEPGTPGTAKSRSVFSKIILRDETLSMDRLYQCSPAFFHAVHGLYVLAGALWMSLSLPLMLPCLPFVILEYTNTTQAFFGPALNDSLTIAGNGSSSSIGIGHSSHMASAASTAASTAASPASSTAAFNATWTPPWDPSLTSTCVILHDVFNYAAAYWVRTRGGNGFIHCSWYRRVIHPVCRGVLCTNARHSHCILHMHSSIVF